LGTAPALPVRNACRLALSGFLHLLSKISFGGGIHSALQDLGRPRDGLVKTFLEGRLSDHDQTDLTGSEFLSCFFQFFAL
jgi:hypothetical protein